MSKTAATSGGEKTQQTKSEAERQQPRLAQLISEEKLREDDQSTTPAHHADHSPDAFTGQVPSTKEVVQPAEDKGSTLT